jgi:glycosyltransferase involved in cell wall biosynthesis
MEKQVSAGVLEWTGHASDMATELTNSHIMCLPSRIGEGVPMALLEAAASGRAIVTTDVAGCREVVRHGENGLLVPPGDAGGLAAALQTLIEDPELRRAMGAAGRLRACKEFALELVLNDTLGMYEELLADGRPRTRNTPMVVSKAGTVGGS